MCRTQLCGTQLYKYQFSLISVIQRIILKINLWEGLILIRATKIPVIETRAGSVTRLLHERSSLSIFPGLIEVIVTHVLSRNSKTMVT